MNSYRVLKSLGRGGPLVAFGLATAMMVSVSAGALAQGGNSSGVPSWAKGSGVSIPVGGTSKQCVADNTTAVSWLDDRSPNVRGGTGATYELYTKFLAIYDKAQWDAKVPLSRFNNDTTKHKNAYDDFKEIADKLFAKAKKYAVEGRLQNTVCQDCILINTWSYLGYLSDIAVKFEINGQSRGKLVAGSNSLDLSIASKDGISNAKDDIETFKSMTEKYDKAPAHTDALFVKLQGAEASCSSGMNATCWSNLSSACSAANTDKLVNDTCTKKIVSELLKGQLEEVIKKVNAKPAATSANQMKSLDANLCVPFGQAPFESLPFRTNAVGP